MKKFAPNGFIYSENKGRSISPKYTFLFLLLLLSACLSDDNGNPIINPPDTSHVKEVAFLSCNNYVSTDLSANMFTFEDFAYSNNFYFFDTGDQLVVREGAPDGSTLFTENIRVNNFLENGTSLMICAAEGVYEVAADGLLQTISTTPCIDMVMTENGTLLLTTDGLNANAISTLEGDQVVPLYTLSGSVTAPACSDLIEIVLLDEQNIFAVSCDNSLVHFRNGVHVATLGLSDYEIPSQPEDGGFYALPFLNDLVVVAKNGTTYFKIMKYTAAGDWIDLKLITSGNAITQAEVDLLVPDLTDAIIWKEKLYLSATYESCPGFMEFDITKDSELLGGDYFLVRDPGMPSLCINKMIVQSDSITVFVITSEDHLTEMDCM